MSVPGIVQSALDGEEIAARVSLGGEDELFITPSSTIIYRAEGLLSDESIDEFSHDADRLTLSEGRRKTRFSLEYPLEGTREFTIPSGKTEDVLHPVLAGVLNGNGITDPGETVVQTYRFSELTLIVTSDRLVKHIGEAVWDGDFEQYHFADVTALSFEDGSVATQIVLEVDGRPQRIKAPNDAADDVTERLKRALFDYHDVGSLEELNATLGVEEEADDGVRSDPSVAFGDGIDPLDADPPEPDEETRAAAEPAGGRSADAAASSVDADDPLADDSATGASDGGTEAETGASDPRTGGVAGSAAETNDPLTGSSTDRRDGESERGADAAGADSTNATDSADAGFAGSGFEPAEPAVSPEVLERLEALEATVERQNELLEKHEQTIEKLIAELRQGR